MRPVGGGRADIVEKVKKGCKAGAKTFEVHLDGYKPRELTTNFILTSAELLITVLWSGTADGAAGRPGRRPARGLQGRRLCPNLLGRGPPIALPAGYQPGAGAGDTGRARWLRTR
jgi:hypothetical protein